MAAPTVTAAAATKPTPTRATGVLAALVILGIVLFALPPASRVWVAGLVVVMALLVRGGDAARIINQLRVKIYGS